MRLASFALPPRTMRGGGGRNFARAVAVRGGNPPFATRPRFAPSRYAPITQNCGIILYNCPLAGYGGN
jgi:hypothetical protein